MPDKQEPIVLELAPLPREQVGPFLILGVDKDAGPEQIEANWARRVVWARKGQLDVPLQDVNWAREVLGDHAKRVQADEIWSFCYAKEKNVKGAKAAPDRAGNVWTWTALDSDSSPNVRRSRTDASSLSGSRVENTQYFGVFLFNCSSILAINQQRHCFSVVVCGRSPDRVCAPYSGIALCAASSPHFGAAPYGTRSPEGCLAIQKEARTPNRDRAPDGRTSPNRM